MESFKKLNRRTSLLATIIAFIITGIFFYFSFASSNENRGLEGLAIFIIAPFIFSLTIFFVNSIFYMIGLLLLKKRNNDLYNQYNARNSFLIILSLIAIFLFLVVNFNIIAAFAFNFLSIVIYAIPVLGIGTFFYSSFIENLSRYNPKKLLLTCMLLYGILISGTVLLQLVLTRYLQYNLQSIDVTASKYGESVLLTRNIEEGCILDSIYSLSDSSVNHLIMNNKDFTIDILKNNILDPKKISFDTYKMIGSNSESVFRFITPVDKPFPVDLKQEIVNYAHSNNNNFLLGAKLLEGPEIITGSIRKSDAVKLVFIYNRVNDNFAAYLVVRSYSEHICNYLQGHILPLKRQYQLQ